VCNQYRFVNDESEEGVTAVSTNCETDENQVSSNENDIDSVVIGSDSSEDTESDDDLMYLEFFITQCNREAAEKAAEQYKNDIPSSDSDTGDESDSDDDNE
jgi:hypothetical protein